MRKMALSQLYWSQCRMLYSCFDANVKSSDSGVYEHEMPGGQYTNLMFQSQQLGLGTQWAAVKKAYVRPLRRRAIHQTTC